MMHPSPAITSTPMHNAKTSLLSFSCLQRSSLCLIGAGLFSLLPAQVFAASEPDPATSPVLAELIKNGAKMFYLGHYADLDGWLAAKGDDVRVIYKSDKNNFYTVGYLFAPNGDNITTEQLHKLGQAHPELSITVEGQPDLKPSAQAEKTAAEKAAAAALPKTESKAEIKNEAPIEPAGERLLKLMKAGAGVTLGSKADIPLLFVMFSPSMPDCVKFWKDIRDRVKKSDVRLRMLPAALANTSDEVLAALLLESKDPLRAWDKFADGDKKQLLGKPDQKSINKVRDNTDIVTKWRFQAAPYILYRAKDGKVKVVQGEPTDLNTVINDAAPETPEASQP